MRTQETLLYFMLAGALLPGCGGSDGTIVGASDSGSIPSGTLNTTQRTTLQREGDSETIVGRIGDVQRWHLSTSGRLVAAPAATSGSVSMDGAGGINHDGTPYHPATFQITGLQGAYSGGSTLFSLPLDAGSAVATGSQARVSYDFEGDGQVDRVETYAYFANNDVPGWEIYRHTQGLRTATGSMRDFQNGTVKLEVWSAIGRFPVNLRIDDASAYVELPVSASTPTTSPTTSPTASPTTSPSPPPPPPPSPSPTPTVDFGGTLYLGSGALTTQPGSGQLVVASADGLNHDGQPYRPLSLRATGLSGHYNGGATGFQVFLDAATQVACATQIRLSYDFDGNGTPDRVETYQYFPTNNVPGWESYTQARGIRSTTGAWADFQGGSLTLEAWSALGQAPTTLRLDGSSLDLPMVSTNTTVPPPTSTTPPTWVMTWNDEFDAPNGTKPVPDKWVAQLGGNGFGNNELQTYTDRLQNCRVEGGHLTIEARKENYTGGDGIARAYTSARLKTVGKFTQQYGKFEARIKIPAGNGMWPAFWMMGQDKDLVGWPACGEIDVMENIGRETSIVHGTAHGPGYSGGSGIGNQYKLPSGQKFSDDYHVYSVEWAPNSIHWLVDGNVYHTLTPANIPAGAPWVFNKPFFILMNVAVGGYWPGSPDATTVFPQQMQVDYLRAYQLTP